MIDLLAFLETCGSNHDAAYLFNLGREITKVTGKILRTAERRPHHYLRNNCEKVCKRSELCLKHGELRCFTSKQILFLFAQVRVTCDSHITTFWINHMQNANFVCIIHAHHGTIVVRFWAEEAKEISSEQLGKTGQLVCAKNGESRNHGEVCETVDGIVSGRPWTGAKTKRCRGTFQHISSFLFQLCKTVRYSDKAFAKTQIRAFRPQNKFCDFNLIPKTFAQKKRLICSVFSLIMHKHLVTGR